MHRIKRGEPLLDAVAQVKAIAPVTGTVLDTATGLGYTAIEAAKTAERVVTIELDPAAREIAQQNPWSQALFSASNIESRLGDSNEIVPTFPENAFDRILHDPPTLALAGELYALELYRELYRVLKRGGILFHYVGDPDSKFGAGITRGVSERLKTAGFRVVKPARAAYGVTALK
jgi:predicted methyltransferase